MSPEYGICVIWDHILLKKLKKIEKTTSFQFFYPYFMSAYFTNGLVSNYKFSAIILLHDLIPRSYGLHGGFPQVQGALFFTRELLHALHILPHH